MDEKIHNIALWLSDEKFRELQKTLSNYQREIYYQLVQVGEPEKLALARVLYVEQDFDI